MRDLVEDDADAVMDAVAALAADLVRGCGLPLEVVASALVMDGLALVAAARGLELAIITAERATDNLRALRHAPGWAPAGRSA